VPYEDWWSTPCPGCFMTIVRMATDKREIFMARQRRVEMTIIKGKELTQLCKWRVHGKAEREDKGEC